ncbi:MAG: putative protein YqcC [Candidatus Celerinatantimonas neptuna]|nr:MAG: putative protein YqcC [Candidatus Celerinatantimonas neptuna]
MDNYQRLRSQLFLLERHLKTAQLWQSHHPSPDQLVSQQPFAIDTLSIEQWLQFIFIPRFHSLLDARTLLPKSMSIAPYAEEAFKEYHQSTDDILQLLKEMDALF